MGFKLEELNAEELTKLKENLRSMVEIQGSDGNWNHDPYMFGMHTGMELMLSAIEGREPAYKEKPDTWLKDEKSYETKSYNPENE